jgi:signal transduction histidine kinase
MGLLGMKERAALVGGRFNIESTPGAGTTIFVRIPLGLDKNGGQSF